MKRGGKSRSGVAIIVGPESVNKSSRLGGSRVEGSSLEDTIDLMWRFLGFKVVYLWHFNCLLPSLRIFPEYLVTVSGLKLALLGQ
jgi:hypothetical protein